MPKFFTTALFPETVKLKTSLMGYTIEHYVRHKSRSMGLSLTTTSSAISEMSLYVSCWMDSRYSKHRGMEVPPAGHSLHSTSTSLLTSACSLCISSLSASYLGQKPQKTSTCSYTHL